MCALLWQKHLMVMSHSSEIERIDGQLNFSSFIRNKLFEQRGKSWLMGRLIIAWPLHWSQENLNNDYFHITTKYFISSWFFPTYMHDDWFFHRQQLHGVCFCLFFVKRTYARMHHQRMSYSWEIHHNSTRI